MNKHRRSSYFLPLSILADTLCINIAYFLSYAIRFQTFQGILDDKHFTLFLFFNATWFMLLVMVKPYREPRITFNIAKLVYNFLLILAIHAALIALFWVYTKGYTFSRLRLTLIYVLAGAMGMGVRFFAVFLLRKLRKEGYNIRTFIVAGYGPLSSTIVDYYDKNPEMGYVFKGYFGKGNLAINDFEEVMDFVKANKVDYVYCCLPYLESERVAQLIDFSQHHQVNIKALMDFRSFTHNGLSVEYHGYLPIINVSAKPYMDNQSMLIKRIFDLTFSTTLMIVGSPIFLLIMLITKLSSKGSVFYKSERIGMWGEKFYMYKFRSMYTNADDIATRLLGGDMHSVGDSDPRTTRWGKIMRKTKLDELPQFINVLKGNMSVVGPRPLPQYDVDMLIDASPLNTKKLLSVKPGITSLGQVQFGYASTQQENVQRMTYDLLYLKKYSLRTDVWLIYLTARVMLQGKGK
jgi:putative colanic acid biosynthesis UDP-glucose lipid carrier transferase